MLGQCSLAIIVPVAAYASCIGVGYNYSYPWYRDAIAFHYSIASFHGMTERERERERLVRFWRTAKEKGGVGADRRSNPREESKSSWPEPKRRLVYCTLSTSPASSSSSSSSGSSSQSALSYILHLRLLTLPSSSPTQSSQNIFSVH